MKGFRSFLIIAVILALFFGSQLGLPINAAENYSVEEIKDFDVTINVQKDSSFLVQEKIIYDIETSYKHGIYRDIPLKKIRISDIGVTDENGKPYKFLVTRTPGLLRIKIGDPNVIIQGEHTYKISYKVANGILFFKNYDELYWNVTGNKWEVPIEKAKLTVNLPRKASLYGIDINCFTGKYGAKNKNCDYSYDESTIRTITTKKISPGEGFTVNISFPKGIVREPGVFQKILWGIKKYWPFSIPPLVLIFLFYKWLTKGRDPKIKKPIIPFYEPPDNLKPAEMEAILKENISDHSVSATFIDLAVRGYLKIKRTKSLISNNDYEIVLLRDFKGSEELLNYEKELLDRIFSGVGKTTLAVVKKMKSLSGIINPISDNCFERLTNLGYFAENPKKVVKKWATIGTIWLFLVSAFSFPFSNLEFELFAYIIALALLGQIGFFGKLYKKIGISENIVKELDRRMSFRSVLLIAVTIVAAILIFMILDYISTPIRSLSLSISLISSSFLFSIFSFFMPKKTKKGAEIHWKILGFREFIRTVEKHRARFNEEENIFEKYLPYAILFGLANKWTLAFSDTVKINPSWYEDTSVATFSVAAFSQTLNHDLSQFNSIISSENINGNDGFGGGFSGGGFGGGGGGSW